MLVEERYCYEQEISRNSRIRRDGVPTGKISLRMPYDGYECFPRDAVRDVERAVGEGSGPDREAIIGHLMFVDHEETDLSDVLGLDGRFGAFSLRVPVRSAQLDSSDALIGDRFEHRFDATYSPSGSRPELVPLRVQVELMDPDHSDQLFTQQRRELYNMHEDSMQSVAEAITKFAGFQPFIMVQVHAHVTLPPRPGKDEDLPVVRRVRVTLPRTASVPASSVSLRGTGMEGLQIDGRIGAMDWQGTVMHRHDMTGDTAPRRFSTHAMVLLFEQPGELFEQHEIEVEVEVEVPGELLSGAQVRMFDARGNQYIRSRVPLAVRSVINTKCTVILGDAFAQRYVSPFQSFVFDEIVPDSMRISDVIAALTDRRFEIVNDVPFPRGGDKKRTKRLLIARRIDGPTTMTLAVYVEGRRYPTRRESRQPIGHRYTSKFESGSLHIYVRGRVRGDTRNLVHEVTAFQRSLRERFRMLKAHR
ncbi:hypothetical protein ACQPWY_25690 [Pseudonocardia xinjiangensis]|uniref:hypothetical protein n=1 Tax=Pseudonocardia xinjiangensis TaxID=75289 RepID=UPI003D8B0280